MESSNKIKLVYAEDDKSLARLVQFKLSREGFEVIHLSSGDEVLDTVIKVKPDIVLLDRMMPIKDGLTALKELKSNSATSHIPVIFLTSQNQEETVVASLEAGAADYIVKPFSTIELITRLKKVIK